MSVELTPVCQFNQHFILLHRFPFAKKLHTQIVKQLRAFVHKNRSKMLVKLTPGLNFTNVLLTAFVLVDPKGVKRYL